MVGQWCNWIVMKNWPLHGMYGSMEVHSAHCPEAGADGSPLPSDADLWIKIWEKFCGLAERGTLVEVEHVKAHRTKNGKTFMSQFEKFVAEGNEKADE